MKIGTRLTIALLLCVMPVLAVYMLLRIHTLSGTYIEDLKRATRATTRALAAGVEPDIVDKDWASVGRSLQLIRQYGVEAAVFKTDGTLRFSRPDFALRPLPRPETLQKAIADGSTEFMFFQNRRYWFCLAVPLVRNNREIVGILLVAREWSDVQRDVNRRIAVSLGFAALFMVLVATIIPIVTGRYVTKPLEELSRRVRGFSSVEQPNLAGDEVELLSEEFRRLDDDLRSARRRLLDESERQLELERRLRRSEKIAAIGTLASGLAHEIGTPLNVIRGRAEYLLAGGRHPPKTAQVLETIINQIDRISATIRMLLDLGSPRLRPRSICDLRTVIQRTLNLLETEAARRNVTFIAELGDRPLLADCDADQLQQVFVNLGVNALDAMDGIGGTLRISAKPDVRDGSGNVRLLFDDGGPGIAESERVRVFDPFFTTKEPGKGSGMGLAVSQSIIRDHNGEISIESRDGGGARFVVTLPLQSQRWEGPGA